MSDVFLFYAPRTRYSIIGVFAGPSGSIFLILRSKNFLKVRDYLRNRLLD